jgi:hypothetical protein
MALALRIVGDNVDEEILEFARTAARAHLDLLRSREARRDIIGRVYFGALGPRPRFRSVSAEIKCIMSRLRDLGSEWR